MYAISKKTGLQVIGIVEHVEGVAGLMDDGFSLDGEGKLAHEHDGGTNMNWDSQVPLLDNGERIYVDEGKNVVLESDVGLSKTEPTAPSADAR